MQSLFTDQGSLPKTRHSQKIRKEANLNAIVENFDGFVWSIDTNLQYIVLNTALRRKIKEILGVDAKPGDKVMDILEMIDASKPKAWSRIYQDGFEGESQRFIDEFSIAGKPAFFDISVNPIRDNETISGLSCFARDITEEVMNDRRLKATEIRFRALIENSTDITVVLNGQGEIIYGSPSIEKNFGITIGEYTGASFYEFIDPEDMPELAEKFLDLLMNPGQQIAVQARARTKDGRQIWTEGIVSNLLQTEGINGIVCNFRDITERVQASEAKRESEVKFRRLIENSSDIILMADANGNFLYGSPAVRKYLGYSESDYLDQFCMMFVHPNSLDYAYKLLSDIVKYPGRLFTVYLSLIHKNGTEIPVEGLASNMLDVPGVNALVANFRDISERKKAEQIINESEDQKIRLQNQLIEEKLHRHQEIIKATIEATEKEREGIGRELHDNVTQILTTARLCLSCIDQKHPAHDMIQRSSNNITTAIEEIRGLSKSMIQSFHREIGLKLSIEDLVESIRVANKFQVSLDFFIPEEQLLDDKLKMTVFRIIQEQLNNILKHAEASEVAISIYQYNEVLALTIIDNGKGFNMQEKRKGIGITNITNRAELFNGQVRIISSPGNGCRMEVSFRLQ